MAKTVVKFTRPVQRILVMLMFLGVVGAVAFYLSGEILRVFNQNQELNGLILVVFFFGVMIAFWQVFRLFSAVNWLEALAARARGIESVPPPSLLVAMDPMRKSPAQRGVAASTARSILDSVGARVEESRDTLRYVAGLLIFLGLLGTFWGLAKTVPAVIETIQSITPSDAEAGGINFGDLIVALEGQLGGMGVAFASSLLGLAGSMVVGFLELMSAGAANRFYGELETWLSTMTRFSGGEGEADGGYSSDLVEQLAYSGQQMAALNRMIADGEDRRAADSARIADALASIERIAAQAQEERATIAEAVQAQSRMLAAVERLADTAMTGGGEGIDAETRGHIRNLDLLMAKMIEESAAGRVETAEALRREMRAVGRAVHEMTASITGGPTA